ncbi:hypothetical protein E4633_08895 [Geomonas terrae]|uniref:Uncharacterized protein n=1 Tax=Geomonas terrae TaxID=2562681 RepID=A0A4S1CFV3_9BACT|nr:hypothetical protein [Geomonas terrae]TGU72414.1 hypothetical protein E4633_08895 [Geomonas terrae]
MDFVGRALVRIATIAAAKAIDKIPEPPKSREELKQFNDTHARFVADTLKRQAEEQTYYDSRGWLGKKWSEFSKSEYLESMIDAFVFGCMFFMFLGIIFVYMSSLYYKVSFLEVCGLYLIGVFLGSLSGCSWISVLSGVLCCIYLKEIERIFIFILSTWL